jgi:hypothetical protein
MCLNCWEEEGSHAIVNDKTKAAAKVIDELYGEQAVGGYLHIVTDDFNVEDHHVASCDPDNDKIMDRPATDIERRCWQVLTDLTKEERVSALAIYEGWIK